MTLSYIIYFQRREDKENFFYSHFQISGRTYYTQLGSKKKRDESTNSCACEGLSGWSPNYEKWKVCQRN